MISWASSMMFTMGERSAFSCMARPLSVYFGWIA
jgi:hypothetical protein